MAKLKINGLKYPSAEAKNDPKIIPESDKGKVRNRAAFSHDLIVDKIN